MLIVILWQTQVLHAWFGTDTITLPLPTRIGEIITDNFSVIAGHIKITVIVALGGLAAGKVGNWGLGNEYEIQALLTKYGLPTTYITQDFTMDQFDEDAVTLASAMTYNELGLVVNSYDGGYSYGDTVSWIDMNDGGVAMLEVAQVYQRSGLVLVYKNDMFTK